MTVPFTYTPSNLRTPLFYAELDPSKANTAASTQRTLLIGQVTAAGTFPAGSPVRIASASAAVAGGGSGSMLAQMAAYYALNDSAAEVWALPVADAAGSVAATGSLTVTGPATASGTISLYVDGVLVPVPVTTGDSATTIATNIAAAINASTGQMNSTMIACGLGVTATAAAAVVTLTARNKGLCGNDINIRLNYLTSAGDQALPSGVDIAIVDMTGGASNASLMAGLAALSDMSFDFIVCGLNDTTSMDALKAFLSDATGRWNPMQQIYGHAFYGMRGTAGTAAALGVARNDQHATLIPAANAPHSPWVWVAAFTGIYATSARADPGVPAQSLTVSGLLAPIIGDRFPLTVRNSTLLYSGCSTWTVDASGNVTVENLITTYTTNAQGSADNSYLQVETLYLLMYVIRALKSMVQTKYARVKLAADGTRIPANSNIVTPSIIRADIIASYRTLEEDEGMVQNSAAFATNLVVEKDATNPSRINVLWPGTLIDALRQFASLIQFRLI